MKLFMIDDFGKNLDIVKKLNEKGIENIDIKKDANIKATKNDIIMLIDGDNIKELPKTPKVILITKNKDKRFVWSFANKYNCIDIIDSAMNRDYIVSRIISVL